MRLASDDQRWHAVAGRDVACDGRFVFAVRTTGIYCRPSCPARRPRRRNVLFFTGPDAAEEAGFRACRRCGPRQAARRDPQLAWVRQVCRHIDRGLDGRLTLGDLAAEVGVAPHHLQRTFKRLLGISPREYADARRLERLKARLREGRPVTDSLYHAGYGSSSRLYERSDTQLGMTPATYRRGGLRMSLAYTVVDSPLGRLLVAATERGVSAVSLGAGDAALEKGLRDEYPAAEIRRDDGALARSVRSLLDHLAGSQPHLDLPVDVRATAFQRRVWQELRTIPYGTTRSYGEVARAIGRPKAARAVARACATNPVALLIPCHRVVAEGGGLGGYRWGTERKRALLDNERASAPAEEPVTAARR